MTLTSWRTCGAAATRSWADLEATRGWITASVQRPVLILGRLDGVETGVRNLIRRRPLEVEQVQVGRRALRVPTLAEIFRIKAVITLDDYYADQIGRGGRRVATQVARQLAEPLPDDLSRVDLASYR